MYVYAIGADLQNMKEPLVPKPKGSSGHIVKCTETMVFTLKEGGGDKQKYIGITIYVCVDIYIIYIYKQKKD